ncbi:hypothetical protein BH10PSE6_BH10PSE6_36340 [soil metagenome]
MKPDDVIRIRHMIEAARTVARFVEGRRRADLEGDTMLGFAIVRAIEIFGEAASKVSREACALAPGIPWAVIIATRNRLIHAYFDIDRDIVWTAATEEIPALLPTLLSLAPED